MKESIVVTSAVIVGLVVLGGLFWFFPTYGVWQREMSGRAQLAEAEWNRQIKIREAEANLESEKLNAQAEVERAKGAAQAMEIEAGTLTPEYIQYLWVKAIDFNESTVIYIPTEAGLPILESQRLTK